MSELFAAIKNRIFESVKDEFLSDKATRYLNAFGYATENLNDLVARIQQAQAILNVPVTGVIDDVTVKAMEMTPRCGHSDREAFNQASGLNQWLKSKAQSGLSYHIVRYVNGLTTQEQEDAIASAFTRWEAVSKLRVFRKNSTDADIIIDASASRSEDFGSAGNVLAWAYLPQGSNHTRQLLMKFDLAERWVIGSTGTNYEIVLETVACHEIGHLLGMNHTQKRGQLMFPTYDVRIDGPQQGYDIEQVVMRYDAPDQSNPQEPLPPTGGQSPLNPFDKAIITLNGKFYKVVPV